MPLKKSYKKEIDYCLDNLYVNLYNEVKKIGLRGRAQPRFTDLASDLFIKEQDYNSDFIALGVYNYSPLKDNENLQNILDNISSQKQNFSDFIESAANSGNPLAYAKSFSRAESFEKARLLHSVIKGRRDLKKIREYGQNEEKQKIGKLLNDVINNVKGSGKEFLQMSGIELDDSSKFLLNYQYKGKENDFLRFLLRSSSREGNCDFNSSLEKKGLSAVRYLNYFIADIDSEYKVNGCLHIYILNNKLEDFRGFFCDDTKKLFVIKGDDEKEIIQHEVEHFIQDGFGLCQTNDSKIKTLKYYPDLNRIKQEYGAFLGQIRLNDNPDAIKIIFERYNRERVENTLNRISGKGEDPSVYYKALGAIFFNIDKRDKSFLKDKKRIIGLHDEIYQKQLGVTYTELEKMVK
jgi:hypothetical protein